MNTPGSLRVTCSVLVLTFVIVFVITTTAADDVELPFQSHFPSEVNQLERSRPMLGGTQFQFLYIKWIRQEQFSDTRTISVLVDALTRPRPRVAWIVNGQLIHDADPQFPQVTSEQHGLLTSINISNTIDISSLRLLLSLDTIQTETEIQVQDLATGKIILEHGTDVALALNLQENVTASSNTDLVFIARFFAEDLSESSFDGLHVRLEREGAVLTPEGNPTILTLWSPTKSEVPTPLRQRFDSPLSQYYMLRMARGYNEGTITFTAEYENNVPCRLFGGQTITRKVVLSAAA